MTSKRVIHTDFFSRPEEYKPWSAGLVVPPGSGLLFMPGMTARDEQGETMFPGDVAQQARRIFEQMRAVVAEAGAGMSDVIKMTVFLARMEDAVPVQPVRNEYWPEDPPVSSTVQVARLVNDSVRIEIEAIAMIAPSTGP